MEKPPVSSRLRTLVGLFDVNVKMTDEVEGFLASIGEEGRAAVRSEYQELLRSNELRAQDFRRATACDAKDEGAARRFFEDVYKYAFEGGEEPDVEDYRIG